MQARSAYGGLFIGMVHVPVSFVGFPLMSCLGGIHIHVYMYFHYYSVRVIIQYCKACPHPMERPLYDYALCKV